MNAMTTTAPAVNIEIEQGVLGALLLNNGCAPALSFLKPEHFAEPLHRAIYEAILSRLADGREASVLTLAGDLPPADDPEITIPGYLAHVAGAAWTASDRIASTAREVVRLAALRRLTTLGGEIAAQAALYGSRAAEIAAWAETELIGISDELARLSAAPEVSPDGIMAEVAERMTSGQHYKGAQSGLVAIDNRLGGLAAGEMIVVAGRPGMGKTMLGLSLARRAAHIGVGVGFDTIESSKTAVWCRLLADETEATERIPHNAIARGRLTTAQFEAVSRASDRLKTLPLHVIDRGNRLSDLPGHIRAARRFLAKQGKELQVLVVDYLGILMPSDRYAGQKVNEVGEISATVKALAKREGIAIVALHQLNRATESRGEDRRPRLSDLRDSGNLEQDADVVMFVYRPAYYIERPGYRSFADEGARIDALTECQNQMEAIVVKQRDGAIGTCRLWCDPATNSVRDEA